METQSAVTDATVEASGLLHESLKPALRVTKSIIFIGIDGGATMLGHGEDCCMVL